MRVLPETLLRCWGVVVEMPNPSETRTPCARRPSCFPHSANLIAWLKVIGPVLYGFLYVRGVSVGLPQAPFILNAVLTTAALLLGPLALAAGSADQKEKD